jgi:hypothetical protein
MAKLDGTNGLIQQYDYQVLTTAFTYTFASGTQTLVINPAGTLATGTITMPAAPADGMVIWITTTKQIVALTMNGNTGQTLTSGVTSLAPNQAVAYIYRVTNTTWYPFETQMAQGNGPAFSAYLLADQSMTANTFTKVTINTEEFDTNSNFNTSNYRFTPTVAGYYQINAAVYPASAVTGINCSIYKNGTGFKSGWGTTASAVVSALIYMNGSTDYLELYTYLQGTTPSCYGNSSLTFFNGCLIRSA